MTPTRKSRSVNKQCTSEVSPVKDVSGSSRSKQKKKLSDKLGPRWSKGELQRFYEAYQNYGKDWKKVASQVRSKSVEMVEALYNMKRAYLSLPEGMTSVVGLIAMMTDHYNVMEGSDSEQESNDASSIPQKSQKCKRAKVQLSGTKEDAFQSLSMASSGGCLSLLKRVGSDGKAANSQSVVGLHVVERTAQLLEEPKENRSWKVLLSKQSLRLSHLWTHSIHIKKDNIMFQNLKLPYSSNALTKWKEKMALSVKKKKEMSIVVAPISQLSTPLTELDSIQAGKRGRSDIVEVDKGDHIQLTFSINISTYSDPRVVLDHVGKLLFPKDDSRLKKIGYPRAADWGVAHAFQALQAQLYFKREMLTLSDRNRELSLSNVMLKADCETARKGEVEMRALFERSEDARLVLEREIVALRTQLAQSKAEIEKLTDRCENISLEAMSTA